MTKTRKQIIEEYEDSMSITSTPTYQQNKIILEVLLDIRDKIKRLK